MKPLTKPLSQKWILLFSISIFIFSACRKQIDQPVKQNEIAAKANNNAVNTKRIYISNVDQLYTAVNDPANAGSMIVLAPGTYLLSAAYPHGGRLELEHNMSLTGQPGHPEDVIIDVSGLPASSLQLPPSPTYPGSFRTGAIRVGNGYNAIEWMTLQNDPFHDIRSLIQSDLVTTPTTQIRIAHTIVKGGSIGISINNSDAVSNGRTIEAVIEDNEITNNIISPFGTGIQIKNSQAVTAAVIRAIMRRNYIHGNKRGIFVFNASSIQSSISAKSYSDRIEANGVGLSLHGGLSEDAAFPTKDNSTLFEAYGTAIRNNSGTPQPPSLNINFPGGVFAAGGIVNKTIVPGTVNDNKLEINFWGCPIEGNIGAFQINAYGAFSAYPSTTPVGSNNITTKHLNGISANATSNAIASFPTEPAGTNIVNVYR